MENFKKEEADQFEATQGLTNRQLDNLRQSKGTFGAAIEALKLGKKVYRSGWNGKGMYLWLLPASIVNKEWIKDPQLLEVFGDREALSMLASIRMKTATGEVLTGWLASQSDMLSEDWTILEDVAD